MKLSEIRERDAANFRKRIATRGDLDDADAYQDRRELLDRLDAAINVLKHYAEQDIGGAARSILPRLTR